jgi:hypothetical protein
VYLQHRNVLAQTRPLSRPECQDMLIHPLDTLDVCIDPPRGIPNFITGDVVVSELQTKLNRSTRPERLQRGREPLQVAYPFLHLGRLLRAFRLH